MQCEFIGLALGDIGADREVLGWETLRTPVHQHGGAHPVQTAVLGAVADFTLPYFATRQPVIHGLKEPLGVKSRAQYGVVLTHKFATAVAADAAKIVIDADDAPLHVSSGHDRMLIQSIALVKELVVQVVNAMLERGGSIC